MTPDPARRTALREAHTLTHGVGFCDVSGRTQIALTGADRAKVLHGLCTNDVKRLTTGRGCEAFLTNVQGKTIGYVWVFCREDSLVLDTAPGFAGVILPSLDRYIIREDVRLADQSAEVGEVLVSGVESLAILETMFGCVIPDERMSVTQGKSSDLSVEIRRVPYASPVCFFVSCPAAQVTSLLRLLQANGASACSADSVDAARIEMGMPVFGQDLSLDNLPQEVARDQLAISFTKGCYLGQETVARIDALGHVNRLLTGIKFSGDVVPPPGSVIEREGKAIATITSSCWSPRLTCPLTLAYVRRGFEQPGTTCPSAFGVGEVVALPLNASLPPTDEGDLDQPARQTTR